MYSDDWHPKELGISIPVLSDLIDFVKTYCDDELQNLAAEYPEKCDIVISYPAIYNSSVGLTRAVEERFFDLEKIFQNVIGNIIDESPATNKIDVSKVRIRIKNTNLNLRKDIRYLSRHDTGKLITLEGFIKSVSDSCEKMTEAAYMCSRCGHTTRIPQNGLRTEENIMCENETCGKKGPFKLLIFDSEFIDFQRILLQEVPDGSKGGVKTVVLECEEQLTNKVNPGDRVLVTGVLESRQVIKKEGKTNFFEKFLKPCYIDVLNRDYEDDEISSSDEDEILALSQELDIKNKLIRSVAPSIHGMDDVKTGLVLSLFSGPRKSLPDGSTLRSRIHLMLVGDPGVAKSQLLRRVVQLSTRGVFVNGSGATAAGLTAAAVKDKLNSDSWTLEAGAAVLADRDILAIDEMEDVRDEAKEALKEVAEQGTTTVSKAGMTVTLPADCSIIAAANPIKGYFNSYESVAEQIGLPPALWSRFDLIFIIKDEVNTARDRQIAEHILRNHVAGTLKYLKKVGDELKAVTPEISDELFRKYVVYSVVNYHPLLTDEAKQALIELYVDIRALKQVRPDSPVPITARSLEALQRLTESSARMRLSEDITIEDVEFVKTLFTKYLKDVGMNENGELDAQKIDGRELRYGPKDQNKKINFFLNFTSKGKTEEELIKAMISEFQISEDEIYFYIKKLKERGSIFFDGKKITSLQE